MSVYIGYRLACEPLPLFSLPPGSAPGLRLRDLDLDLDLDLGDLDLDLLTHDKNLCDLAQPTEIHFCRLIC